MLRPPSSDCVPSGGVDAGMTALTSVIRSDVESVGRALGPAARELAGTTLLVAGGGGFLCSYFLDVVAWLNDEGLQRPCRVICVDNLRTGMRGRLGHLLGRADFRFLEHDITGPLHLDEAVDWVIHGASIASPVYYRRFPLETIAVNVEGTRQLLEFACRSRVRSLLYLSSSEIYGDPDRDAIPTPETYLGRVSCTGPRAPYDESKRLAETLCGVYYGRHGVPVKTARPFNIYGPGQRLDDRRIIPDLMSSALRSAPIVLHSDGRATRSFCYIADAVDAMMRLLLSPYDGEAFNVGNDHEEMSVWDAARCLQEIAGDPRLTIESQPSTDPDYLRDNPRRRCPDLTKLRTRFAWDPAVCLRAGLARTLAHYREASAKAVGA